MKRVYKYPVVLSDYPVLMLPSGAEILSVQDQGGTICLWALVDPDAPLTARRLKIAGTGHPIDESVKFLGTVQYSQFVHALVWHVFEVTS